MLQRKSTNLPQVGDPHAVSRRSPKRRDGTAQYQNSGALVATPGRLINGPDLIALQRIVGNRLVGRLLAAPPVGRSTAIAQRDTDDSEEDTGEGGIDIKPPDAYYQFADLRRAEAKNQCRNAARAIGIALGAEGYSRVDYVCVLHWAIGSEPATTNHFAAIGNDIVFDATAQQDPGGEPTIEPFEEWLSRVRGRNATQSGALCRWFRGSLSECERFEKTAGVGWFWNADSGKSLLDYSAEKLREHRRIAEMKHGEKVKEVGEAESWAPRDSGEWK